MEGSNPPLHHNTVAPWERAEELEQQGSEPALRSHLSSHSSAKFYFLYYPFAIFHIFATNCYHHSLLLGLGNLLPHLATSCHDMPRLGPCWQVGLYKMEGSNPPPAPQAGVDLYKMEGSNPHLHHNTVALWERAEELEQQGSQPALRSHLSSHSSAKFCFLCYPFTSLLPSLLTSWFGQPPAISCHILPRLGPCWQGGSL